MCVATNAICQPQTKNPSVKNIKLLLVKASLKASEAVCLLSWLLVPAGILGVLTNYEIIKPMPNNKQKYKIVISQPISIKEYLTSNNFVRLKDKGKEKQKTLDQKKPKVKRNWEDIIN